ncbi:DUF2721 domain-containing protein [bacterium]|nr:DUF2721 domain-containing protein [bacterium]
MFTQTLDATPFISSALAPAVAISACAILASNAQSKYSSLVDRIRALNAERREYQRLDPISVTESLRIKSLDRQIALIFRRSKHMRDAIFLLYAAIACIISTSFLIAAMQYFQLKNLTHAPKVTFLSGLVLVLAALVMELLEVRLTFRVLRYELGLFDQETAKEAERSFRGV